MPTPSTTMSVNVERANTVTNPATMAPRLLKNVLMCKEYRKIQYWEQVLHQFAAERLAQKVWPQQERQSSFHKVQLQEPDGKEPHGKPESSGACLIIDTDFFHGGKGNGKYYSTLFRNR